MTAANSLKGKGTIVTGSTSGIGLGIARAFAAEGAHVMLNGFGDAGEIERLRQEIATRHNVQVAYSSADMSKPDQIERMVREAESAFGSVDAVVNNAGIQFVSPVESFPIEKWDAILAINLSSAFHVVRAALPGMRARKWGRIVNVASAHGLTASAFKSAYVAAKHGVVGFTRTIAMEGAPDGITCNAICPGYVLTPLVEKQIDDQAKAHKIPREQVIRDIMLKQHAIKEFVTVEDLAALAVFLCSNAARTITGTAIAMDGGWTQH
ncbi:MAG: 3-hydroxybutyrate dehydrogenase [Alphaproteobacteria bacterium]|nr:3-hydroxybutyrate dehydrogenase [Alphaproteobacteria bacterium]